MSTRVDTPLRLFADQLGPATYGGEHSHREVLLVEATSALRRRPYHRQKLHLVLSALRHAHHDLGDRPPLLRTETYVLVFEPTSHAAEKFVHRLCSPGYTRNNKLAARTSLPTWWRELDADSVTAECLRQALPGVRDRGWTHPIQRLMVLGNHALQRGYQPSELTEWFATAYVDGFSWVSRPTSSG